MIAFEEERLAEDVVVVRGEDLANDRRARGLRQVDIGRVLGVSGQRVAAVERSKKPSPRMLERYLRALAELSEFARRHRREGNAVTEHHAVHITASHPSHDEIVRVRRLEAVQRFLAASPKDVLPSWIAQESKVLEALAAMKSGLAVVLGLDAEAATEEMILSRVKDVFSVATPENKQTAKRLAVALFEWKVAGAREAEPEISHGEAQVQVSREEPELYAASYGRE